MNTQNIYNNNNKDKDININSSTKIKICGLTSPAEARYLNENHVDFAGMVLFFPKSKRNISIEQAKEIMAALDASIKRVAVVVSPSIEQVRQIEAAGFDYVQIHAEIPETETEAEAAIAIPILKAFNVSDMDNYEILTESMYPQVWKMMTERARIRTRYMILLRQLNHKI